MVDPVRRRWTDHDLERLIGLLLRAGVLAAAAVSAGGGVLYLLRHASDPADYRTFQGEPLYLRTVTGIVGGVLVYPSEAVIAVGVLLLLATPIARVALSLIGFAKEGDHCYVAITAVVLSLLLFGLLGTHP